MQSFIPWFYRYLMLRLKELVITPREFHPHETHFFSLFIKALPCHKKYIYDKLLNINEILRKLW